MKKKIFPLVLFTSIDSIKSFFLLHEKGFNLFFLFDIFIISIVFCYRKEVTMAERLKLGIRLSPGEVVGSIPTVASDLACGI